MKIAAFIAIAGVFVFQACAPQTIESEDLSKGIIGRYTNEEGYMVFTPDNCLSYGTDNELQAEGPYIVRGNYVYISPPEEHLEMMIRRVFLVYEISGNRLVASHLEDMDTGDRFYEELAGSVVFVKD